VDRFGVALRVEDRGLAVGIDDPELCLCVAVRPSNCLLRLEADAVDRVLRGNRLVLRLDRRLDRGPEAVGIGDPGNLEIDDLDPIKPSQIG
jgi:hypothetical protein